MPGKRTGSGGTDYSRWSNSDPRWKDVPLAVAQRERRKRIAAFEKALNARFKRDGIKAKVTK